MRGCAQCHGGPGVDWGQNRQRNLRPDPPDLDVAKDVTVAQFLGGEDGYRMPSFGRVGADDKEILARFPFLSRNCRAFPTAHVVTPAHSPSNDNKTHPQKEDEDQPTRRRSTSIRAIRLIGRPCKFIFIAGQTPSDSVTNRSIPRIKASIGHHDAIHSKPPVRPGDDVGPPSMSMRCKKTLREMKRPENKEFPPIIVLVGGNSLFSGRFRPARATLFAARRHRG